MSDLFPGWTTTGLVGTVVTVLVAAWRKVRSSSPQSPSLLSRLARVLSAISRLQIAEGDMAAMKESLIQRERDGTYYRDRLTEARAEIQSLNDEITRLRSSADSGPSGRSSGGYTGRRGVRTRKKPTT